MRKSAKPCTLSRSSIIRSPAEELELLRRGDLDVLDAHQRDEHRRILVRDLVAVVVGVQELKVVAAFFRDRDWGIGCRPPPNGLSAVLCHGEGGIHPGLVVAGQVAAGNVQRFGQIDATRGFP